ncbi:hypothetical protein BV20DRAFT_973430 [Pilatotrama ljubarskyi]|nr:hypothetical protein BV20DRAFT_973430 [Pilatotrama ljubarskyi]
MPAVSRAVFVGLHAAALVSLVDPSFSPFAALASPVALPMPLMPHLADYAARPPSRNNTTTVPQAGNVSLVRRKDVAVVSHTTSKQPFLATRDDVDTSILDNINILGNMYSQMNDHSRVINEYASRSGTEGNDPDFNQQAVSEVAAYQDGLLGFQALLAQLAADKGLANYDRTDELETLLKNLVNLTKNTLKAIDILVYNIPVFGPELGPIVYEIKCILDDVLDAVENLTDALINAVRPLIVALIGQAITSACNSGVQLGSLCLVL